MITLFIILLCILPGIPVAKKAYANALRTYRLNPKSINAKNEPRPERPKIRLNEMMHQSGIHAKTGKREPGLTRCQRLDYPAAACTCAYREDWIALREKWRIYDEWEPSSKRMPEPKPGYFIPVVFLWPLVLLVMYISTGAKGIPDPAAVERMENELRELQENLDNMKEIT